MDRALLDTLSAEFGEALAESDSGGKIPVVTCTIEYPLMEEHLAAYTERHGSLNTTVKSDEKDINVIRARHHGVARFLAAGLPEGIVAELTNFTPGYISTLKNNPSMLELIAHYRAPGNNAAAQITEKLRTVGTAAVESLLADLENGKLDAQAKLGLAKLGLDRSDHGPSSKQTVLNETRVVDVAELAKLELSARKRNSERVVDIRTIREALPSPVDPDEPTDAEFTELNQQGPVS